MKYGANQSAVRTAAVGALLVTAIATLTYIPTTSYTGSDTLTVITNDLGNTGYGVNSDTDTVGITVTSPPPPPPSEFRAEFSSGSALESYTPDVGTGFTCSHTGKLVISSGLVSQTGTTPGADCYAFINPAPASADYQIETAITLPDAGGGNEFVVWLELLPCQ